MTRALRALSSCYIERREKLGSGAALEGAGKRAAFGLFYGPLHFFTVTEILRAVEANRRPPHTIHDLGCGTGVAGAAWSLACQRQPAIAGLDRNAWAVAEASWTYRELGLRGRAKTGEVVRDYPKATVEGSAVLLAYAVNELADDQRAALLDALCASIQRGAQFLIVEPIAKRDRPWWPTWSARLTGLGAREDEWRFRPTLPPSLVQIAKSAGLDVTELKARTLARL